MSSSSLSWATSPSSGSLFPLLSSLIQPISNEEFKLFHSIDRKLFSNLLFNHGRVARESMLVMAFWMWIQREDNYCRKLIEKISNISSPHQVSQVVNETVICLRCIQNEHFIFSGCDEEIENLQSLMEGKRLRLQELHENRVEILSSVMTIADETCGRAFKDILEDTFGASIVFNNPNEGRNNSSSNRIGTFMPPVIGMPSYPSGVPQIGLSEVPDFVPDEGVGHGNGMGVQHFAPNEGVGHGNGMGMSHFVPDEGVGHGNNGMGMPHFAPNEGVGHRNGMGMPHFVPNEGVGHGNRMGLVHFVPNQVHGMNGMGMAQHLVPRDGHGLAAMVVPNHAVVPSHMVDFGPNVDNRNFNVINDLQNQQAQNREFVNRDLELMMRRFHISEHRSEVPADDRTLFLTFSKGYPISENELRNFFTRKFGDFIEAIFMQEVAPNQQSLYARIVARTPSDIYWILKNERTVKFYINGKHVWARQYVKNNTPRTPGRGGPVR